MMKKARDLRTRDVGTLLLDLRSPDERVRAKAVQALCPCRAGWKLFEEHMELVDQLKKDPSPVVRKQALHVFEDAGELESSGYPTHPRAATDEMLRKKRQSRMRPEQDELQASRGREKAGHRGRDKSR